MKCNKCKCSFDRSKNAWWDYKSHSEPVKVTQCPECKQIYVIKYGDKYTEPEYMDLNYIINNNL